MTAWWFQNGLVLYNNRYEPIVEAQHDLFLADIIGIYFGSYSSRATRLQTKFVKKFYTEIRAKTRKFQIIFCSMDDNEKDCSDFVLAEHGDWLVIPWSDQATRRIARNQCNVTTHPSLVILKNEADGIVISLEGKEEFQELGKDAYERWQELARAAVKDS